MVAVGVVAVDFEHHAGDALGAGVVVSAFGVGVGRECLLGDGVSEFCDTDRSALSHRRFSSAGVIPHCHPSLQQSKFVSIRWIVAGILIGIVGGLLLNRAGGAGVPLFGVVELGADLFIRLLQMQEHAGIAV